MKLRTSELKNTILKMFRRNEFYGYEIKKQLELENLDIDLSRIYRVLNEMERDSLLKGRWEKSTVGPRRKMYSIGNEGTRKLNKLLLEAIGIVHDFYGDYLISLYPKIRVFDDIFNWLSDGLKGDENIAYLVSDNSPMHDMVIKNLLLRVPEGRLFIIMSKKVTRELKIKGGIFMNGDFDNIPLKDDYIDLLLSINLPKENKLTEFFIECSRTLNDNGKLGIITPTILIEKYKDPLTIGDFIEKYEHEVIEKGEHIEKNLLTTLIKEKFKVVREKEIVHLTLFLASNPLTSQ